VEFRQALDDITEPVFNRPGQDQRGSKESYHKGGQHVHRFLRPPAAAGLHDIRTAVPSARNQNCDFDGGSTRWFLQQRSKDAVRELSVGEASNAEDSFTINSHD
jgi:hypothetical protein